LEFDRRKLRRRLIGTLGSCSHGYLLQDESDGEVWLLAVDASPLGRPIDRRLIGRRVIADGHFVPLCVLDVSWIEALHPLPDRRGWLRRFLGI